MNVHKALVALLVALTVVVIGCGQGGKDDDSGALAATKDTPKTPVAKSPATKANDAGATTPVVINDPAKPDEPAKEPAVEKKEAETLPAVVAKVGDEVITGPDFGWQLDYRKKMSQMRGMPLVMDDKKRHELLEDAVKEKILLIVAKKSGAAVTDEESKAEIDKQKAAIGARLAEMGLSDEQFQALVKENMILNKFVEAKKKEMTVSDDELKAEYEKYKAQGKLDQPASTDVAHILIKVEGTDDAAWAKGKEKIDAARKRIVGGEDFAKVAKEVSEDPGSKDKGGAYPGTPKGKMVPEFEDMMEKTPVGQVSEPFKTKFGWHILTVTAKNEAKSPSFDEIKDRLKEFMLQPKLKPMMDQVVADARKDIKIEIFLPGGDADAAKASEAKPDAPKADAPKAPDAKADAPKASEPKAPDAKPAPEGAEKSQ